MGAAALEWDRPLRVRDASRDPRFDEESDGRDGLEVETAALCAVAHQGRLLGMLQVLDRRHEPAFTEADANLLAYVAEKLGEFLHGVRLRADEKRT
jgi:GAF domain-containing protein